MNTKDFIAIEEKYGAHNYHPLDVVIERAEGVWVYDVDGKKYLDCLSAYSAVNQGHVHPQILNALLEQAKKVTLTSRAFRNDQLPLLYKELSEMTGYEMSLPMNSGAEAVETALKLARKWAYQVKGVPRHQAEIITAAGNFHGRTVSIISFSTEPSYRDDFGPFTPGFVNVPYGDADAIERAITPNTAAVLLEPIQGEGGVIIPPAGYLKTVAEICAQLKDPARNGGRKLEELIHHIGEDTLVGWAWSPGGGRSAVPGTQKQAGALVEAWVKTGAACPAH